MLRKITLLLALVAILCGCASPPAPYVLSPDVPHANIQSSINGADGRYESIGVYVWSRIGTPGTKQLFSIKRSVSTPGGYVRVAAKEPLNLSYSEAASGGRSCQLAIQVILEEGKNYSLVGGFAYEKGPIPILTDTRKCQFGVMDEATGRLVPYRKL